MTDDLPAEMKPGLDKLLAKRALQTEALKKTNIAINALYEAFDLAAPYPEIGEGTGAISIRPGQFYGQPLATNVRAILEMRRTAGFGNASSINDIYKSLLDGGYVFDAKDDTNAKTGLRQSLRKNPIFHKIPSGHWGLLAWFPNAKIEKDDKDETEETDSPSASDEKPKGEKTEPAAAAVSAETKAQPKESGSSKKRGDADNGKTASAT